MVLLKIKLLNKPKRFSKEDAIDNGKNCRNIGILTIPPPKPLILVITKPINTIIDI
jgi:hypothetical protein